MRGVPLPEDVPLPPLLPPDDDEDEEPLDPLPLEDEEELPPPRPPPPPLRLWSSAPESTKLLNAAGTASAWMVVMKPRRYRRVCCTFMMTSVVCRDRRGRLGVGSGRGAKYARCPKLWCVCVCLSRRCVGINALAWVSKAKVRPARYMEVARGGVDKGSGSSGQLRLVALLSESVTTEVSVLHLQRLIIFSPVSLGTSAADPSLTSWTGATGQPTDPSIPCPRS